MAASWSDEWRTALDDLEQTLESTERLLDGDVAAEPVLPGWSPPDLPGPIPAEYAVRARALLGRQQELISRTVSATVGVSQKIELLDKLTASRRGARDGNPVYVDLTA